MATRAFQAAPLDLALSVIPSLPRPLLSRIVARAIERLDEMDGDPDLEDATNAEDEGVTWRAVSFASRDGAGCPVSDPGGGNVEDQGEQQDRLRPTYGMDQSLGPIAR